MPSNYDQITRDNIRRRGEEFDDIGRLISEQLYSDRSHFVYELLQNAEDALERRFRDDHQSNSPCGVKFHLFKDKLEFRHFGQLFKEEDVKGISDVLKGTKSEDSTQIGKFGIGFKSVYAFTATPEIHSGDEHFVIERYIRPKATDPCSSVVQGETLFIFPFNHKDLSEDKAFDLISNKLRRLGPRILLFLNRINEIEWRVEPSRKKGQYLKESQDRGKARQVTVIGQNNGKDEEEKWLVFDRSVPAPDGACTVKKAEVAFKLKINGKDQAETITKIKDSPLVVYFPTKIDTRFGFLVQGPYDTVASRSDIENNDWNKVLVKETSVLLTKALRCLKEMGLLTVALLEALPIRMDDFPEDSMFIPIVEGVRDTLMNEELLPADDGTFVSARNARLASAEWLRTLLREEQLRQIFKTENPLKWISGEITERPKHDLWKYICEELKVEEVTPDSFARKIEGSFLEKQTDDWMIAFYSQLVGQKALWKAGSNSWGDKSGPLRAKEFLRLEDGSHVRPFRDDDSPNAYLTLGTNIDTTLPIVRSNISQHEEARKFLKELGVPELDVVEEVIERILPKYTTDSSQVSIDEHRCDMAKIEQAYKTDSQEKKHRLKERLRATPFILTEKPGIEITSYKRSTEAYFRNDELVAYFSGSDTIGFIKGDYPQSMLEIFRELGASDSIRISCKSRPGSTEFVSLECSFEYRRGLRGFDPDIHVEGLEHALINISVEKGEIIWNKVAVQYSHCIKGKILRSSRQDFSPNASTYKEEETISDFGHLLTDSAWLPRHDGKFYKPGEIGLDDLPETFVRDEKLADQLSMKKDVVAKLAEQAGVQAEDIELLKQHPKEFQEWKAAIAAKKGPSFPIKRSTDLDRRKKKIIEKYKNAPKKKYEKVIQSAKITENTIDAKTWLNETYKNKAGELICQICEKEMPFKKRDGNYYFEAIEILRDFDREMEELHIALCPLCAAMYNEFVKLDEDAMETFKDALMNSDEPEVSLRLGDLNTSVRFVESHYRDIKTILGAQE